LLSLKGDFVAFIPPSGRLRPNALLEVAQRLCAQPDLDLIYTDEDLEDVSGNRAHPHFKPDWSPDLLYSSNYVGQLAVFRREIVAAAGGPAADDSVDSEYELVLRVTERTDRVGHIAQPLYTSRLTAGSSGSFLGVPAKQAAGRTALANALARRGIAGEVLEGHAPGTYRVRYQVRGEPLVSIVIPTRDKADLLETCIDSMLRHTSYSNYEIVVVDNDSVEAPTRE
jgi:hypothetical protein